MNPVLGESYLHLHDPFFIQFTENTGIRWYGLAYLVGFVIAMVLLYWLARTGRCGLSTQNVTNFQVYAILGIFVGGRLGYCIFYEPRLFWDPPLIGIIQIWKGGMSSHGGFIGVILSIIFFARKQGVSILHVMDLSALAAPPGLGLGRMGNFINAELWGKALPPQLQADPPWWSIKYPSEILGSHFPRVGELEALKHLVGGPADPGSLKIALFDAIQHGNKEVIEAVTPLLTAYYPSQIFQAITDGPILFLLMALLWLFPLKPGCVTGGFLVSYGILRITTELFRQPDAGVALLPTPLGDLSRGQTLSVLMVLSGTVLITICALRKAQVMGCLRKSLLPGTRDGTGGDSSSANPPDLGE